MDTVLTSEKLKKWGENTLVVKADALLSSVVLWIITYILMATTVGSMEITSLSRLFPSLS